MSTGSSADQQAIQSILDEAFTLFRDRLESIQTSNDPEAVHQTRVCWRRFKSALHLFKPLLQEDCIPTDEVLKPMLKSLSRLRDLDVARFQSLPQLSSAYMDGTTARTQEWERLTRRFADANRQQRKTFRATWRDPEVQTTLDNTSQWIRELPLHVGLFASGTRTEQDWRTWTEHRVSKMHRQLRKAGVDADTPQDLHRVRIQAKHLRYAVEILRADLPHKHADRWHREATELQTRIGRTRDLARMNTLASELQIPSNIAERLRNIANSFAEQE